MARLAVTLPKSLYRRLKLYAHENDTTITAVLVQLIKAELAIAKSSESPK